MPTAAVSAIHTRRSLEGIAARSASTVIIETKPTAMTIAYASAPEPAAPPEAVSAISPASAPGIATAATVTAARVRGPAPASSGIRRSTILIHRRIGSAARGFSRSGRMNGVAAWRPARVEATLGSSDADRRGPLLQLRAPRAAAGPAAVPPLALRALARPAPGGRRLADERARRPARARQARLARRAPDVRAATAGRPAGRARAASGGGRARDPRRHRVRPRPAPARGA